MAQHESLLWSKSGARGYLGSSIISPVAFKVPTMNRHNNLLSFLAIAQYYGFELIPVKWHEALDPLGQGATAEVRQAFVTSTTTFAFKRAIFMRPFSNDSDLEHFEKVCNALVSEILVLGHPSIRYHPNIIALEGVYLEIAADNPNVWPVLILEKAPLGDLQSLMCSEEGRKMSIVEKLQICLDIASAIMAMHRCNMTHGDIKPQNILMFEEKAFQKKPRFIYAKLADFGYAGWCVDESKDILYPARSRPWEPPEYHHRGFLLREAKRIDIYCFGLLCLWILFEETLSSSRMSFLEDLTGNKTHGPLINLHPGKEFYDIDCIYQLKNDDLLPTLAGHLIRAEATLSIQQKQTLLFFFTSSLAYDPTIRPTTLDQLASVLDQECAFGPRTIDPDQSDLGRLYAVFELSEGYEFFMRAHHRIREEIAACIQKEAIGSSVEILKTHAAFQYALCAKVGFGRPANDVDSEQWLKISGKSIDDLEAEIELLKKNMARGSYKDAYVSNLMARSGSAQYSRFHNDDDLDTVEKIYRREIEDMDFVFGTGSLVVLRHKLFLAGLLEESSVGRYKEAESIRVQIIEESRHRPSWIISPPAQVPASASIWHVEGSEEMLDIRPPELKLGLTFLQNLATLADSQIHYATDNLYGLATSFHRQGRLEEAEWLYVHVRNIEKEESGAVHPHTLDTTFNLAVLYENQGRYREAEKAFTYVTKWRLTWFGKQHPQTLRVQANLAVVYAYLGRLAEAETLLSAVYTEQKRILGPENKLSLLSMKGLEYVHSKHGNLKAMEILRRQRLKVCVDLLGETHPDTLVAMVDVAESLVAQQIWGEADALASEVLKIQTSVVCDDNASRAINMCHALKCLQESLRDQRRWSEAEEVSMRLVEMRKSRLGTTHIQTMTDMWCRGDILWRLGRWREAAICFFNAVPWQYGRFREFVGQFHKESIPFWPGTRSFYSLGTLLLFGIVFQVRRYRKA